MDFKKAREKIRLLINQGVPDDTPDRIKVMLTEICFMMYVKGFNDSLIVTKEALNRLKFEDEETPHA